MVLVKKAQARTWKKVSPTFKFVIITFLYLKTPNPLGAWKLQRCPIFAKPLLDIFAVSSLVYRINLSHMQLGYLCRKNQNYLLGKTDLEFFLSYRLRTTIKIIIFSTFYVIDVFSSCFSWNSCKKKTGSFNKTLF